MAFEQNMTQAIMQAANKATKHKTVIMVVRKANNPIHSAKHILTVPRLGSSLLRQPTFDWKTADNYQYMGE